MSTTRGCEKILIFRQDLGGFEGEEKEKKKEKKKKQFLRHLQKMLVGITPFENEELRQHFNVWQSLKIDEPR